MIPLGTEPVVIGLDVGTTAVKVMAFDIEGSSGVRAMAIRNCPLLQAEPGKAPVPGQQIVDPFALLTAVDEALALCVRQLGQTPVLAISLSTAMHALIGFDAGRRPLTPVITWADSRSADRAESLRQQGIATELLHRTGTPVHSMSPLVKLAWLRQEDPELCGRVRWWGGIKELVVHHLTGRMLSEPSNASGYGLMDVSTLQWDPGACEVAGIDTDQLPELVPVTTRLELADEVAGVVGLPGGTTVVIGAADGPLGNLGTGAINPGVVGLSLRTSGAVRMPVPEPTFDESGRLFCYSLTEDLWVTGGPVSNGGVAFDWAARTFAPDVLSGSDPGQALEMAATAPLGSDGLVMVPYLLGERAPLWDASLPGAFLGVRHGHARQHFLRAAVEGVCLQVASIIDVLDSVVEVDSVRATGGPFRAQLWRNVMAAVVGRPFYVASDAGGTALGAATLGVYALGEADTLPEALTVLGGRVAGSDPGEQPLSVSATDVAGYRQVRRGMPSLVRGYLAVADAWGDELGD